MHQTVEKFALSRNLTFDKSLPNKLASHYHRKLTNHVLEADEIAFSRSINHQLDSLINFLRQLSKLTLCIKYVITFSHMKLSKKNALVLFKAFLDGNRHLSFYCSNFYHSILYDSDWNTFFIELIFQCQNWKAFPLTAFYY